MTSEELFLSKLQLIERIVASICRRHGFFGDEADEFDAWVKLKLIDKDYAALRKFQGKCLLKTYLTTVIANLFRDYLIQKHGKWRSSAMAKRRGPEAVRLESLLYRQGLSVSEAVESLKRNLGVEASREALEDLAARLPVRLPRRFEGEDRLNRLPENGKVEQRVRDRERADTVERLEDALQRALARLAHEDRLILKLWLEGISIAAIAKRLGLAQRRLYTRRDKSLKELATDLKREGLGAAKIRELLGWEGLELQLGLSDEKNDPKDAREAGIR